MTRALGAEVVFIIVVTLLEGRKICCILIYWLIEKRLEMLDDVLTEVLVLFDSTLS